MRLIAATGLLLLALAGCAHAPQRLVVEIDDYQSRRARRMASDGAAIVTRARALIGTRFRPHGRSAAGIDCVGLAAAALNRAAPPDYALRGGAAEMLAAGLRAAGLKRRRKRRPGDLLAMQSGPEQLHLGIWAGAGIVHADARLRRVVERPGEPPWPVIGIWRED